MMKKCVDCRKEYEAKTDNELFCEECRKKDTHKSHVSVLKIYDKI